MSVNKKTTQETELDLGSITGDEYIRVATTGANWKQKYSVFKEWIFAGITGNRALVSDANGFPVASSVTDTELSYVEGVTSPIQDQINNMNPGTKLYLFNNFI